MAADGGAADGGAKSGVGATISGVADWAVGASAEAFPTSARRVFALSLLDWTAVAVAGAEEPVSEIVRDLAAAEGGRAEATIVGFAAKLPARAAALVNGATSHALDYDDTHFLHVGHTSVAVVPAALAMAERTGASGRALLDAALIGSEAACRIGAWLGRAHYQAGFHQTATSGAFGAALAASRLLELSPERARHALGIATTRASGLKSQFGTMGKPYHAGMAASIGVEAALLAAAGFVSRPDGLDCPQGFAETHAGEAGDPAAALDGLGARFVFEAVQHKLHACCHGLHAMLEALAALRAAHGFAAETIETVTVRTNPRWLKVCDIAAPATGLEAKFSYRLTAAMALSGVDTAKLETFADAACADAAMNALRDRVAVVADAALSDTAAVAAVALRDGRTLEGAYDLADAAPIDARAAKVRRKAAALLGADRERAVWSSIEALAEGPIEPFTAHLRA